VIITLAPRCVLFRDCEAVSVCQRCITGPARPSSEGCRKSDKNNNFGRSGTNLNLANSFNSRDPLIKFLTFIFFSNAHNKQYIQFDTGGVAQWSWHPPEEQKIRVRIPPRCKFFRENMTMLLYKLAKCGFVREI
jgi:hypothetical protein